MINFKEQLRITYLLLFITRGAYSLFSSGLMHRPLEGDVTIFTVLATSIAQHGSHVTQGKAANAEMDTTMQWYVMLETKFQLYWIATV